MNARLLAQGYKPISKEVVLQIPGFKKPVECCFVEYNLKNQVNTHFVMASKKNDILFILLAINPELSKVVWNNIDKFENEEIKNTILNYATSNYKTLSEPKRSYEDGYFYGEQHYLQRIQKAEIIKETFGL